MRHQICAYVCSLYSHSITASARISLSPNTSCSQELTLSRKLQIVVDAEDISSCNSVSCKADEYYNIEVAFW